MTGDNRPVSVARPQQQGNPYAPRMMAAPQQGYQPRAQNPQAQAVDYSYKPQYTPSATPIQVSNPRWVPQQQIAPSRFRRGSVVNRTYTQPIQQYDANGQPINVAEEE